jgi:hypothetical protein
VDDVWVGARSLWPCLPTRCQLEHLMRYVQILTSSYLCANSGTQYIWKWIFKFKKNTYLSFPCQMYGWFHKFVFQKKKCLVMIYYGVSTPSFQIIPQGSHVFFFRVIPIMIRMLDLYSITWDTYSSIHLIKTKNSMVSLNLCKY